MQFEDQQKYSLVVQGGGQKGAFAAGVLDVFIKADFDPFSLYLGTSAGALNVSSYVTKQGGLGLDFILNYTTKDRFFDVNKLVSREQPMDLDWAFEFVNSGEFPLDIQKGAAFLGDEREALACVTNADEMKDYYFPIFADNWFDVMRATCAIPMLYFRDVEFDGAQWVDGGVSATVPVQEAYRRGSRDIVVITTEAIKEEPEYSSNLPSLDSLMNEWTQSFEPYLAKMAPLSQHEIIGRVGQFFRENLNQLKGESETLFKSVPASWLPDTAQFSKLLEQEPNQWPGRQYAPRHMQMLFSHYMNHLQVERFINAPPEGVTIREIAPEKPLLCSGLLSHKNDIIADYMSGMLAGREFLNTLKDA